MVEVKPDSDATRRLLERVQAGEREAVEELFARHRPWLQHLVDLRLEAPLRARLDPSDVVQEAHLEAFRRLPDYLERRPMPFRLWLRKTLKERWRMLERQHLEAARRAIGRELPSPITRTSSTSMPMTPPFRRSWRRVRRTWSASWDRSARRGDIERARALQERLVREHPAVPEFRKGLSLITQLEWVHALGPFRLLTHKTVREELKLSAEQVRRVTRLREQEAELFRDFPPGVGEDGRQKLDNLLAATKALVEALPPAQSRRLRQLVWQQLGPQAWSDPDVAEALRLTERQQKQVRAIQDEIRQARRGPPWTWGRNPAGPDGKSSAERLLGVLTDEQKTWWAEMLGEPFKEVIRFGPPGGFPPRWP